MQQVIVTEIYVHARRPTSDHNRSHLRNNMGRIACTITNIVKWTKHWQWRSQLSFYQAEICLCGRDKCNNADPVPEVSSLILALKEDDQIELIQLCTAHAQVPTTAATGAPSGGKMCYDCGYIIDGWTQDGPNYQHPMTDGTPQAMPILKIDTNSYKGCPLKRLIIKFKKLLLSGLFGTPFTFSVGTRQHWQTMWLLALTRANAVEWFASSTSSKL